MKNKLLLCLKGVAIAGLISSLTGANYVSAVKDDSNVNPHNEVYNRERAYKLAIQETAEKYEVNAILMATEIQEWDLFGSGEDSDSNVSGKFENLDELFSKLSENRGEHESYYKKYKENEMKRIEEQEDLESPTNLDFLAVSDVTISYYYDSENKQLSQLLRIVGKSKVFRCTIIYDLNGSPINYLEA